MRATILTFSGGVETGKTTISRAVAERLSWQWGSFGDYVRREADRRCLDARDRRTLEDLGQSLVSVAPDAFVSSFLSSIHWCNKLVLDGLRHVEVLNSLIRLTAPSRVALVLLDADFTVRTFRHRDDGESGDLQSIDDHPAERQVFTVLRDRAELRLDSSGSREGCITTVLDWVKTNLADS